MLAQAGAAITYDIVQIDGKPKLLAYPV